MIAKVEPLTPARALRGPFDYRVGSLEGVGVGSMLVVPFSGRQLLGVVVDVTDRSDVPDERLVEPISALEADVPASLVRLGLWTARQYVSTPARGLALVLPPGTGTGSARPLRPRRSLRAEITAEGLAALAANAPELDPTPAAAGSAPDPMPAATGPAPDSARAAEPGPGPVSVADSAGRRGPRLGPRQLAALRFLADGPVGVAALGRAAGCDHSTLRRLEQRGLVRLDNAVEAPRRPRIQRVGGAGASGQLTADQVAALDRIVGRLDEPAEPLLLHGVTGSGKTEVYLQAVAAAVERGRSAIVLVPEIALTPQTAGRFVERFGDGVAVIHSQLSGRERFDEWWRMRRGEAQVCVGPRSAVFAPFDDLGLIVIDEEHDGSYKQEGDPRYDARRVAERRAAEEGALLLVGSATPRPESYRAYERIEMPRRVDGQRLPPVEIVSMAGVDGALHRRTREALDDVRRRGEKAIVLLNRRGWSNFLSCRVCARVWGCPNCDVTLVLHQAAGTIACHHCGHREHVPDACPDCGSVSIGRHGAGTEQVERELAGIVAPLPVFRLDSDSAAAHGVGTILRRFDDAAAGVLIGTQMVAKGHDFPDVTLGVVLDADSTLRFPDFRSEERTFALVAQLAGRSGRGRAGGRVVVQALDADARALHYAAAHDADGFLAAELGRREALLYPPYGHLVRLTCACEEEQGPEIAAATAIRERLSAADVPVLGPAPLFRRQGKFRAQLVIRSADREVAITAVREAVEAVAADRAHAKAIFSVDVDPQ